MTFKKGQPKPAKSGRSKGTPNRNSLRVLDDLDKAGVNLPAEILKRIQKVEDVEKQLAYLFRLCRYVYPRVNSIDTELQRDEGAPAKAAASGATLDPKALGAMLAAAAKADG